MSELRERTLNQPELVAGVLHRRANGKTVPQISKAMGISKDRVYRVIKAFAARTEANQ